jgi:hypothetical protein
VYEGVRDLPGIKFRKLPDPAGEIGSAVFLGFKAKDQRDAYMKLMQAENVPAQPPGGSVILPTLKHFETKRTAHPNWPSFTVGRGPAIKYGKESCPQTLDVLSRFAGVSLDPKFTRQDIDDVVAAIRKVYPKVVA